MREREREGRGERASTALEMLIVAEVSEGGRETDRQIEGWMHAWMHAVARCA